MADSALQALTRAIRARATAASELWGQNAYPDYAPSSATRPYLIFFWMGGGESNWRKTPDADIVMGIKVVADSQAQAFVGAARISALFNDVGTQDTGTALNGGANWEITTSTQGRIIHLVEQVSGVSQLYHEGHQISFHLESI